MIHLVPVSKRLPEIPAIRALYREAFPPEEQAPFWLLMRKTTLPMTDFWAFYEQETWVGFAYVIQNETLAYLFYLAIAPEQRGKGYGHQAMACLKEQYASKTLFLSLERWMNRQEIMSSGKNGMHFISSVACPICHIRFKRARFFMMEWALAEKFIHLIMII